MHILTIYVLSEHLPHILTELGPLAHEPDLWPIKPKLSKCTKSRVLQFITLNYQIYKPNYLTSIRTLANSQNTNFPAFRLFSFYRSSYERVSVTHLFCDDSLSRSTHELPTIKSLTYYSRYQINTE